MLLQWACLTPQGPTTDLAAVIFTKPVQVSSIRIFPTGAIPFTKCPEIIALTEPEAFFLDVFFNALPVNPTNSAQESQRKNVLVPTRIAYAGGSTEFKVEMGSDYATRLIIFRGQFNTISMAIYGDIVGDRSEAVEYDPTTLNLPSPVSLSTALDLAMVDNPTSLAEQLLLLMPSPTPLPLVIRLMFCLKPEEEDWDNPDFPYVYSNFEKALNDDDVENEVFDLGSLVQSVSKPLKDDISAESLTELAGKMKDLLGSDPIDDAYYVAKLLTKSACQNPLFSRILLQHIDLTDIFNEQTLDETTVLCLAEAAASIEISRYFLDDPVVQILESLVKSVKTPEIVQRALKKLIGRIYGWQSFENALDNPDGDFLASSAFLKDISSDEFALGCWLECMINRKELAHKLATNPIPSDLFPRLKPLFQENPISISHQEFIMFVRAFLGVCTVLSMLAWSDSLGNDICCERTLNILVVWQGVDGYREILNHCLSLRQMARRLAWIKNDEDEQKPKRTGILVERLLTGLTKDPQVMLRSDVVTTVLALKPPFCHISADEMLEMEKLARVAQDGLLSAFEEITFESQRPLSLRRLRVLRVSIAIICEELSSDRGPWHTLESFWNDREQRLVSRLIAILVDISDDLNQHSSETIPTMSYALSELLFRTGTDILHLTLRLCKTEALTSRDLRTLTGAIVGMYAQAGETVAHFSGYSPLSHNAADDLKHICSILLFELSRPNVRVEPDVSAATVILRVLLERGSKPVGRDPVHYVSQVYALVDTILPHQSHDEENFDSSFWASSVFPHIFWELKFFIRFLDPDRRLSIMQRLIDIDNGDIGLGEWLLEQDLKDLSSTVEELSKNHISADYRLILQGHLCLGIQLWESLVSSPRSSLWIVRTLFSNTDFCVSFNTWLSLLLDARLSSVTLSRLGRDLAGYHHDLGAEVKFTVSLLLLRTAQQDTSAFAALHFVPEILNNTPPAAIISQTLRTEVGHLFTAHSAQGSSITDSVAEAILSIMEWLASQADIKLTTLTGISVENFDYLCKKIAKVFSSDQQELLSSLRSKLSVDDDDLLLPSSIQLPETVTLHLHSLENFLSSETIEPSTPKRGTKTPDILGVIISPPTAILRSPAATGLTKTYANNDFRQLRQSTSTRLNTSRLPSTHVDEFESAPLELLPPIDPLSFQGLPSSL